VQKHTGPSSSSTRRQTIVQIDGDGFTINGRPTYEGRAFEGVAVEGLLMNSRMVQGAFDDLNPQTRSWWDYPDGPWDPERNTREFIAAMPTWREHGLLAFTINFQGGSPRGYSKEQPWVNSAYDLATGAHRPDYLGRLGRIIDRADELGMVVILGLFYFGQEPRFAGEQVVVQACDNAIDWVLARGDTNVLIEVANECDIIYKHDIIRPARAPELIRRTQERSREKVRGAAGRLLVSTSYSGGKVPDANVVDAVDFVLVHGNGVGDPSRIEQMVDQTRALSTYRGQPILFNEDDHFDFDRPRNNMLAALGRHASWGYFDYRMAGEGFDDGYQSVPTNWGISSARKRGFFDLLHRVTGG
jgi:hypothetical protein